MTDPEPEPTITGSSEADRSAAGTAATQEVARGELVEVDGAEVATDEERREAVEEPAKVMRIGSMIKQLLEEVRSAELDGPARERLKEIYDSSIQEVGAALSPDLRAELERVAIPFGDTTEPSDAELRIAQAQLVGWLEGLFHGIQATLFAQQMAARNQLEEMQKQLPPGARPRPGPGGGPVSANVGEGDLGESRPGTYL